MAETIHIVVADDHPVVRDGLVAILETQRDFQVVGQAGSGEEAVALVQRLEPEVPLLDLEMPGLDGVEVLRRLRAARVPTQAIIFTAFDSDERIVAAVQAGAQGYLLKGAPRGDIFRAIRVVSEGGSLLEPVVASKLAASPERAGGARAAGGTAHRARGAGAARVGAGQDEPGNCRRAGHYRAHRKVSCQLDFGQVGGGEPHGGGHACRA